MSEFGGLWKHEKITRMHLYPRRRNVAFEVAEELKTVTYATPPVEERIVVCVQRSTLTKAVSILSAPFSRNGRSTTTLL